jgi:hypothetical protein
MQNKDYQKNWRLKNKDKIKVYRKKNLEKINSQRRANYRKNRKKLLKWKHEHKEQHRITNKIWMEKNRIKWNLWQKEFYRQIKIKGVKLLGGKCQKCELIVKIGKDENLCIFDFHHLNPEEKEYHSETKTKKLLEEIKTGKIMLLCANCHRLEHHKS